MGILDVDHFLTLTSICVAFAWPRRLNPRAVDFETSRVLTCSHSQLLKFGCTFVELLKFCLFENFMTSCVDRETFQNNYTVLFLNWTSGTSPIILHTNMKTLERWPHFFSFRIFSNVMSTSSFPFPSLCCSTSRLTLCCGMPQ